MLYTDEREPWVHWLVYLCLSNTDVFSQAKKFSWASKLHSSPAKLTDEMFYVLRATELIQFSQCDLPPKILESTSQKNCKWKCWFFFSAKSLWKCWQDQSTNASLQDSPLFPPLKYIICITSLHLVSSPCSLRFLECPICT